MASLSFRITFALIVSLALASTITSQEQSAEQVIDELYDHVTFDAGTTPDWNAVKELFLEEAVIVLRTSRTDNTVFSLDGWVNDFVQFIERANVEKTGFVEKIVRKKAMVFGDIAHVLVLYEASIPGSERPSQQGVDSCQLIRKNNRWLIASIVNEIPTPGRPVPEMLK